MTPPPNVKVNAASANTMINGEVIMGKNKDDKIKGLLSDCAELAYYIKELTGGEYENCGVYKICKKHLGEQYEQTIK